MRTRARAWGPERLAGLGLAALLLVGLAACQHSANLANGPNANEATPSCLPPGYRYATSDSNAPPPEPQGTELDAKLAVVDGEVITRRRLVREAGPRVPPETESQYDQKIRQRLLERSQLLIFVHEARRIGIHIPPQQLDEFVDRNLEDQVRAVEKNTGVETTPARILAERNLTRDEYKDQVRESILVELYMRSLTHGIGPKGRPQVDLDPSPAEARSIYLTAPGAFDEKAGVEFAVWQIPVDRYLTDDVGFLEAEEKAQKDAEALAAAFAAGTPAAELAKRYDLPRPARWNDFPEVVDDADRLERQFGHAAAAWLLAPGRKQGDVKVLAEAEGPLVLGVHEVRPSRRIPYEKAYEKIVERVRGIRQERLAEQRLIELLTTRSVVQPPDLADAIVGMAQRRLEELDRDPVNRLVRFR